MMNHIIQQVKTSHRTKSYILLALCFMLAVIVFMRSGDEVKQSEDELTVKPQIIRATNPMAGQKAGGLGEVREGDSEVSELIEKIKPILEEKSEKKFDSIEPLNYKRQTVAGVNYFIKAKAKVTDGNEMIIHLRIYQDLKRQLELTAFQLDKQEHDELTYFQ